MAKTYYWLKFQKDFFRSLRIKKLRKLAGGDTFTIIYLKLQLLSLATDGHLVFKGIFPTFEEEMEEEIGEEVENIKITIQYLISCGLMEVDGDDYFLPYVPLNTGSECESAGRVRNYREKQKALQCNTDVTKCNVTLVTCNTEIEKEKDIDKDICIPKNKIPPTLEMVKDYCSERGNGIDAGKFFDFYESKGWMVGKNKMKDWQSAVRTWERANGFKPNEAVKKKEEPVEKHIDLWSD